MVLPRGTKTCMVLPRDIRRGAGGLLRDCSGTSLCGYTWKIPQPSPKTWIRRFFASLFPYSLFEMLKVPTLSWLGCVSQLAEGKGRTATEAKDRKSPVPVFEGIEKKQGMSWVVGKRSHVYMNASGSRALGWSKEDSSHLTQREENSFWLVWPELNKSRIKASPVRHSPAFLSLVAVSECPLNSTGRVFLSNWK